jgi:hypothetical protein
MTTATHAVLKTNQGLSFRSATTTAIQGLDVRLLKGTWVALTS